MPAGPFIFGLEARDAIAIAGTLVAALIGVLGVVLAFALERRDRYITRLDGTVGGIIREIAIRRQALHAYVSERPSTEGRDALLRAWVYSARGRSPGGPPDDALLAGVRIATFAGSRHRDRRILNIILQTVGYFSLATVDWQIEYLPILSSVITAWKTGESNVRRTTTELLRAGLAAMNDAAAYADRVHKKDASETED